MIQKYLLILNVLLLFIELTKSQFQRIMVSSFTDTILIPCKSSDESIIISDLPNDIKNLPGLKIHTSSSQLEQTDSQQDFTLDGTNLDFYFIRKVNDINDASEISSVICDLQDFEIDFSGLENVFFTGIYYFENTSDYEQQEIIQLSQLENFIINNVAQAIDIKGFQIQPQDIQTTLIEITSTDTLHINNFIIQGNSESEDQVLEIHFTEILQEVKITDLKISNFSKGFLLEIANSTDVVFDNLEIENNGENIILSDAQNQIGIQINQSEPVTFNNLQYHHNQGFSLGIQDGEYIEFLNASFENNTNLFGPIVYLSNCDFISIIDNSQFLNNKVGNSSALNIENSTNVIIQNSSFEENTGSNYGGGLNISFTDKITISEVNFNGNRANYGSAIYTQYVTDLQIQKCQISENIADLYGGFLFLDNSYNVDLKENNFQYNQAEFGGCIYMRNSDNIHVFSNDFIDNNGILSSGSIYGLSVYNLLIENCNFSSNSSGNTGGGAVYFYSSENMTITNSIFELNKSQSSGAAVMLVQSNNFTCEYSKFNNNTVKYGYGGAIRVDRENTLIKIKNSDFNFNSGMYGGALSFNTEQDTTLVQNCSFYNNTAQYQGGAIYQDYALSSIEDSVFTNNYSFQGGCIYINFSKKAKLLNVKMQNNSARQANSIYAKESNNLQFIKTQISGQISYRLSNIFLQKIDNIYIQDSNFTDNSCQRNGGVLRIENCGIVDIQESNFKNNTAGYLSDDDSSYTGGAIYIIETDKFSLNNVVFQDNSATYKGGAVSLSQISDFQIEFSEFYNNYVSFDRSQERKDKIGDYNLSKGGSIYYETLFSDLEENQELTFSIQISDCKFQNNSASSGSSVYIHQNITDKSYQINFPKIQNIVIKEDVTDVGLFRILSEETYNKNLFNGIQNQDSIIYVGTDIVQQGYSFNEKSSLNDKLQFSLCPSGTYLAEGGKVACNICQDHGQCDGGYGYYYPDDGYWRLTSTSTQYVYCENAPENCLKNDTCSEGFNGVLCEQCDYNNGFFESVGGGCTECPSQFVSITYIVLAFLIFLAVLALTVFVLQEKVRQVNYKKEIYIIWKKNIIHENNSTSIAKIGIMHIQIIYLLNPTNIEFPNAFSGLAKYFSNPGNTVSVSFYCVNQVLGSMFTQSKIFQFFSYSQVISVGILISLFLTILIYNRKALKRKINTVKYQLVCVFIIWFIYQQAGILESCIQFLVCRQIGDIKYSLADINLECDSSYYQKYVQPINIVILLLFLIIIPILMFYKMYRSRHSNYTIKNQCSYGYLYIDLKNELYYWEYLSMFQKIGITIICQTFFKQFILKYYFCLCVVVIYFIFCKLCYPYKSYKVNRFQLISSISLVCVIFSSIIMKYQDTDSQLSEQLIKIFCQVITFGTNFLFFIYGVYIYYPNIKYKILAYSLTYFKKCSGNYLKNYFEKQQKIQNNWKILKDNFRNFQKVMKNEKYKNLNRAFLFYNINQQDIMEGIKKGDYKKLNEKVFESYESKIFSQNSVQLKKAKNYVDMLKSMNSLNNVNQVQSNRSIKTILQLSRQNDNYSIAVLEEELKSGESNNDRQRQYSSGNEQSSNESDEIQSRKKIDQYSNKEQQQQNSIQKINNSQDSDINIPQETNKQMMFDDLDQKWLQFKSQRSYDQQNYIQQLQQQQSQPSQIQNIQQHMNKQYLETSDYIKQNISQGDIETYRQKNKFTVQSEPFENIFSNPSDRNYRRKNTINNQNTTENLIHLLSLDSGSNLQEKIRKNHIYLDNQIIENSEELQNMNKLSSKNSKTHQNQALPFTIKQSDKNTHEISIDNKIEANELESQDYKNINKIDPTNNIEDSDKKENNQKNRLIPENSSKQQQNLKGSILSQSQIPSKNSSSQESSKQIPSEKISYFTDSYQNEIMGDFESKEQNTNEQSNTKDNSCRPVTQKQESDSSKENTNKNDNNNKS